MLVLVEKKDYERNGITRAAIRWLLKLHKRTYTVRYVGTNVTHRIAAFATIAVKTIF